MKPLIKMNFLLTVFTTLFVNAYSQPLNLFELNKLLSLESKVEKVQSMLSLEEKVALCHGQSKFSVSGVPRLGIPGLWMSDGPHGIRAEINWNSWDYSGWTNDSCTVFPSMTCLAASWDPELSNLYGKAIGAEARYRGKDILLAPGVNIYRTPLNGRNFEYLGEDPYLSSRMAVPYIKGVQSNGVAACVKHYMANNQETQRGSINVEMSNRALNEIYLPAFKAAVTEGGVMAVMGAFNRFRGDYCCENKYLLGDILKKQWNFKGIVISDWDAVHNTVNAANAGLDIEMGTEGRKDFNDYYLALPFLKEIKSGRIDQQVLDEKVRRILRTIFLTSLNPQRPLGSFGTKEHSEISRKIAEAGIVLLKNDNNILPLNLKKIKSIAVIGDNATRPLTIGGGSSELKARYEISPLQGITKRLPANVKVSYSQGYDINGKNSDSLVNDAIQIAKRSDLVLFFGGLNKEPGQDCEGTDRKDMRLPYGQDQLIKALTEANPNTVVVIISGNATEMPWIKQVPALLQAWYPGMEGGNALAAILCGDTNPSGKLPFTFPVDLSDSPTHKLDAYPGDGITVKYLEDIYVGYRWFDSKKIKPLFPFGFGLSYTNFSIDNLSFDKNEITKDDNLTCRIHVKNTGVRQGAEVIQLYLSPINPEEDRPVKELKAFKKVTLKANEDQTVEFKLTSKDFSIYSQKEDRWKIASGSYRVMLGNSADNILEEQKIVVK